MATSTVRCTKFLRAPLVTVVIPTYNRGNFILRALDSLEAQSFEGFEVVICDDGSNDGTDELVARYSNIFSFTCRYARTTHQGVAGTRNLGIKLARGRYIALLDSDDTYHSYKLEAQVDLMERVPEATFCYTGYKLENTGLCIDPGIFRLEKFLSANYLCCASVMMRWSAITRVGGYDPNLVLAEDWDLLIRLALTGPVVRVSDPMYEYFIHPGQSTNQSALLSYFTNLVRQRYGGKENSPTPYLNSLG
jgi:glycosyltransferase involved in cell wall biosynthesis